MFYSPSEGLHCPRSHWVHNQAETGISFIQSIHVPDFSSDFIRMMVMAIMGDNPSPSAFHALPVHWWVCGECCACVCGTVTRRLHVSSHGPGAGRLGSPPPDQPKAIEKRDPDTRNRNLPLPLDNPSVTSESRFPGGACDKCHFIRWCAHTEVCEVLGQAGWKTLPQT